MPIELLSLKDARKLTSKSKEGTLTVVFCALPGCGHCEAMKPIFSELATEFGCCKVNLVQVNAGQEGNAAMDKQLKNWIGTGAPNGYPAFYAWNGTQYKGNRLGSCTKAAFRDWMLGKGLDCSMCPTK